MPGIGNTIKLSLSKREKKPHEARDKSSSHQRNDDEDVILDELIIEEVHTKGMGYNSDGWNVVNINILIQSKSTSIIAVFNVIIIC